MYNLIEKEVKKDAEEVEDEYEFAFLSLAKRANKYLTNDQKEDLLQDVEEAKSSTRLVVEKKITACSSSSSSSCSSTNISKLCFTTSTTSGQCCYSATDYEQ